MYHNFFCCLALVRFQAIADIARKKLLRKNNEGKINFTIDPLLLPHSIYLWVGCGVDVRDLKWLYLLSTQLSEIKNFLIFI